MNKNESKYFNTALLMDEALLILLETKEFEFITVKEICLKAGVNRSTFYLHYQNVNELLIEAIEMINKRYLDEGIILNSQTLTFKNIEMPTSKTLTITFDDGLILNFTSDHNIVYNGGNYYLVEIIKKTKETHYTFWKDFLSLSIEIYIEKKEWRSI